MSNRIIILVSLLFIGNLHGEKVPKRMLVEHFTNTLCSVCASRNPGFKANLNNESNYTLLSIHPSSPYPSCLFNNHDKRGNDGRTKFYGIYGGTPRIAVNGTVISSSADYSKSTIFDAYRNDSSEFSIRIDQLKTSDKVKFKVVIQRVDGSGSGTANLYFVMAMDSVNYSAPNGETFHRNVLRKSLTDSAGISIQLPEMSGDSSVHYFEYVIESGVDVTNFIGIAILQNLNKECLQSAATLRTAQNQQLSILKQSSKLSGLNIYPNPASVFIQLADLDMQESDELKIISSEGKMYDLSYEQSGISIGHLPSGVYYLQLTNKEGVYIRQFQVSR